MLQLKQWELYRLKSVPLHLCCYSVAQSCPILCDPIGCSRPGFPVLHHLPELSQTVVHWVRDAIQPSHPLLSHSLPAFNLSQYQGLFQWVSSFLFKIYILIFYGNHHYHHSTYFILSFSIKLYICMCLQIPIYEFC